MTNRQLHVLRQRVAQVPRGRGLRFPPPLRTALAVWATQRLAAGASWSEIAHETGVPMRTLKRWAATPPAPALAPAIAMRPVAVHDVPDAATSAARTVTLVAPSGWRLEGVAVDAALTFLRGLP